MMPRNRAVERQTSSRSGRLPRASDVAPPNGATARPSAAASARNEATSAGRSGSTTRLGMRPSTVTVVGSASFASAGWNSERIDAVLLRHRLGAQRPDLAAHVALREELL